MNKVKVDSREYSEYYIRRKQKTEDIKVLPQPRPQTHIEKFLFSIPLRVTS